MYITVQTSDNGPSEKWITSLYTMDHCLPQISRKISRRFPDFTKDLRISTEISRFHAGFPRQGVPQVADPSVGSLNKDYNTWLNRKFSRAKLKA